MVIKILLRGFKITYGRYPIKFNFSRGYEINKNLRISL